MTDRQDRQGQVEAPRPPGCICHGLTLRQIANGESQKVTSHALGVEGVEERPVVGTERKADSGEVRAGFSGQRVVSPEDLLAGRERLLETLSGRRGVAAACLDGAAQREHAREVVGIVGGAGVVIDANRLVNVLEGRAYLAQSGGVPREIRQSPRDVRVVGADRSPPQVERSLVEHAGSGEVSPGRHDLRERVDASGDVRMIRPEAGRPRTHRPLLQALGNSARSPSFKARSASLCTTVAVIECPGPRHFS